MRIEHIAIWSKNIDQLKEFYTQFFGATANNRYINEKKQFESYFLSFSGGARLELMQMPTIPENLNNSEQQYLGLIHLAIEVGGRDKVLELTEQLRRDGYTIVSEPRTTGDGYFESCILDPDGNRVEIVA